MDSRNGGVVEIGAVSINATDENNAYIKIGATTIKAKLLFTVISWWLAFIFFIPIFRLPMGGFSTRWVNGFTVLIGIGNNRGVFSIIFILLMPLLVVFLLHFKEKVEAQIVFVKGNLFTIIAGSYGFSFLMLWASRAIVRSEYGFVARGTPFFGLIVLTYLAVIAFSVLWLLSSKGMGFKIGGGYIMDNNPNQQPEVVVSPNNYVGVRREGITVIILSIVTCGIYALYWYYVTMEDINRATGEQRINSALLLVGIICCAPIAWYVLYQMDKNVARLSAESGTHYKENFILWLLLSLVAGVGVFVAMFQISGALNEIWAKRAGVSHS